MFGCLFNRLRQSAYDIFIIGLKSMVFFVLLPFDKLRVTANLIFEVKVSVIFTLNLSDMTVIGFWKIDTRNKFF